MIHDWSKWEKWEAEYARSRQVDYEKNLAVFEDMYEHARLMGAFKDRDPLEGIEFKIRLAKELNAPRNASNDR